MRCWLERRYIQRLRRAQYQMLELTQVNHGVWIHDRGIKAANDLAWDPENHG